MSCAGTIVRNRIDSPHDKRGDLPIRQLPIRQLPIRRLPICQEGQLATCRTPLLSADEDDLDEFDDDDFDDEFDDDFEEDFDDEFDDDEDGDEAEESDELDSCFSPGDGRSLGDDPGNDCPGDEGPAKL
jgi:hypothetical protein